jgi:hypothetical protein
MSLFLFYALVVLFVLAAIFLLIRTKIGGTFFIIPAVIFILTSGIYTYQTLLGSPTTKELPKDFFVLSYVADEKNGKIYVWIIEKNDPVPVSHAIPYNATTHQSLESGMREVEGSKGAKGLKGHWDSKDGLGLDVYQFIDQPHLRKDPPGN